MPSPVSSMPPLRALLCATDLEADALPALQRAAQWAAARQAPLHLLHVLGGPAIFGLRQWMGAESAAEAGLRLRAADELQQWAAHGGVHGVSLHPRVAVGPVADTVHREADALDAEAVLIGPGSGGARALWLGSTADRIVRQARRPVLLVRRPATAAYRRVAVALDLSPTAPACLAAACRLFTGAHFVLHHNWSVPFEEKLRFAGVDPATLDAYALALPARALEQMQALARAQGLPDADWTPSLQRGDAAHTLAHAARAAGCDVVVVGQHGPEPGPAGLLGSTTRHVLAAADLDVLVVPLPGDAAEGPA